MKQYPLTLTLAAALIATSVFAADPPITQDNFIKGSLAVTWETRLPQNRDGEFPKIDVTDNFVYDVTVGTTFYKGAVKCKPHIFSKHLGRVLQVGDCKYDVNVGVINPANPAQTKTVGKIVGNYAIDQNGQVNLADTPVRMEVQSIGQAKGFTSNYTGVFTGKPPKAETTISKLKAEAVKKTATVTRMIGEKSISVNLSNVDPLVFQNTGLPSGPSGNYPESTVNGQLIYSYDSDNWFPQLTINQGDAKDTLGGGIKWVEENKGVARYELNVILNESKGGVANEASAFADAKGEDAFFASDPGLSLINGIIGFRTSVGGVNNLPAKTDISFNIGLQKVTAQQAQSFWKLLMLIPNQMYGE
jgi:hypothetical protein